MTESEEQYVAALLKQIEVLKEHVELLKKYPEAGGNVKIQHD